MTKQPPRFRVLQNRNLRAILLLAGACLPPGAIMLYLYAANPMEVGLRPILTAAAFLPLLATMIFAFAAFLFRSAEEELPSPDIHWMHCDGMPGFDAYADRQDGFRDFPQDNAFEISTAAQFEACRRTQCAVVCLMCPNYYDRMLADRFATHEKAMEFYRNSDVRAARELAARRLSRNGRYHGFPAKGYQLRFLPEEPHLAATPLNISRYPVNAFVGSRNYGYL